jgi:hypothetical protein
MKLRLCDFFGEIEWLRIADRLWVDEQHRGLEDLIQLSVEDIQDLAKFANGKSINAKRQVPELKLLLKNLQYKYEQLYIADVNGDYFNADGQTNNIVDRVYFHEVLRGHTVVSEPVINKSTNNPIIVVATPLWDHDLVIGLFGATILLNSFYKGLRFLPSPACLKTKLEKGRKRRKCTTRVTSKSHLFEAA